MVAVICGAYLLYTSLTAPKTMPAPLTALQKVSVYKKTDAEKAVYTVPPTHPRELVIKKLGVDANILPVGVADNVIGAPESAWDVGWYNESGLPGRSSGAAMLIDGHVNDALNSPGVFYRLSTLGEGDQIELQRGDGQWFTYAVKSVSNVPLSQVDMAKMLQSAEQNKEGLNLITCGGWYNATKKTYDHRVLVFAVRVT